MKRKIMWSLVPTDMQDISEITGSDHPHICTIVLKSNIGRDRGTVNNHVDLIGFNRRLLTKLRQPFQHSFRLVFWGASDLVEIHSVVSFENQIRISPTDVDTDSSHNRLPRGPRK